MFLIKRQEFGEVGQIAFRDVVTDIQSHSPSPPRREC